MVMTTYGLSAATAAIQSRSVRQFNSRGNWGTVANTVTGGVAGGVGAYAVTRTSTTKIYRSVSKEEAQDIKINGQFNVVWGEMECKQFGFNLAETRRFGNTVGQSIIVSARVPTNMLSQLYTEGVDVRIFHNGTLTVYADQVNAFNQAVKGTIRFMP